jgi:hypothetical protein
MAKWYAAGIEASFLKPVSGGYVFQCPAFMGGGYRNRLVNEAQKAEIINILERWKLLVIFWTFVAFPLMLAVGVIVIAQVAAIWHPSPGQAAGEVQAWLVLVGVVIVFVPIAHARRRLRPLLATLPTTEERITFRERSETAARKASGALLGLGLGMGCLMIVLSIIAAIYGHERLLSLLVWFAIGAAATVNFGWLIILRKRTRGNAA